MNNPKKSIHFSRQTLPKYSGIKADSRIVTVNTSPADSVTDFPVVPPPPQRLSASELPPRDPPPPPPPATMSLSPSLPDRHRFVAVPEPAGGPRVMVRVPHRSRPPLRFDRTFLDARDNQLKLAQLICGLIALLFTVQCWPNPVFPYCLARLVSFFQLFNAVCVHGFFLAGTLCLTVAHLFSAPDAFYHYNFPLLETFYCTLATAMYLLGSAFAMVNLFRATFALIWFFQVASTLCAFGVYAAELWIRWKRDQMAKKELQHNHSLNYIT